MPDFILEILQESVTVAFAAFALWMLKKSYEERTKTEAKRAEEWKIQRDQEREDKVLVTTVLREVAAEQAKMSTKMAEMCAILRGLADKVEKER